MRKLLSKVKEAAIGTLKTVVTIVFSGKGGT